MLSSQPPANTPPVTTPPATSPVWSGMQGAAIRTLVTAALALAASMYTMHPNDTWIQIVLTAFSTLGMHAIPAIGQSK